MLRPLRRVTGFTCRILSRQKNEHGAPRSRAARYLHFTPSFRSKGGGYLFVTIHPRSKLRGILDKQIKKEGHVLCDPFHRDAALTGPKARRVGVQLPRRYYYVGK